jgi:hypothetical protein
MVPTRSLVVVREILGDRTGDILLKDQYGNLWIKNEYSPQYTGDRKGVLIGNQIYEK